MINSDGHTLGNRVMIQTNTSMMSHNFDFHKNEPLKPWTQEEDDVLIETID